VNIRDNLRSFLSKQQLALLQKKTELGRQVAEIEKLNANIDLLENEMKQQRRD
jgi:outer membrane murein-binding lipoprotein Lpp